MLDIFSGLRLVIKHRPINIDNTIFRFHWFLTSTILVSFSLIITARQYVGQPIECHSTDKIPETLLNSYCWVQSTFTVPQACNQRVGIDVPYPCIDNSKGREIKMFAYYQWVGIVLFIQGILFHLPYYLWKIWEAGLIRAITGGLRVTVLSDVERCKKKEIVIEYLHKHMGYHKSYALRYFICELFCLLNLLLQLWATDKFFDGQFVNYGLDVMKYNSSPDTANNNLQQQQQHHQLQLNSNNHHNQQLREKQSTSQSEHQLTAISNNVTKIEPRVDPMTFIFPRITKCTYYDFGSSGDIQKHDAICLLPLNIVNEKIYIALWFWFLILALLTLMVIVFRFFILVSKAVRAKVLRSRCKLSAEEHVNIISYNGDIGDWFLFYMMANNLDPIIMREIVAEIALRLEEEMMMSDKATEAWSSYARQQSHSNTVCDSNNIDLTTTTTTTNALAEEMAASFSTTTTTSTRTKKLRRRLNLKGFLRGGKLFSIEDQSPRRSSSCIKTSMGLGAATRGHMKRLNSLQDDRQHLFNGQLSLDLDDGSSRTYYLSSRLSDRLMDKQQHSSRQLLTRTNTASSGYSSAQNRLTETDESSPISRETSLDDELSSPVHSSNLVLSRPNRAETSSGNLMEIRLRNRSSERRGSNQSSKQTHNEASASLFQNQIYSNNSDVANDNCVTTSSDAAMANGKRLPLALSCPPVRHLDRSMAIVNMSS